MNRIKRILFPFGIFVISAVFCVGGAAAGVGGYFYVSLRQDISDFERTTQQYLVPLLDACAHMGSLDGGKKSGMKMNALFREYRQGNIVFKAFFVRDDGSLIAHSGDDEMKALNNNIAADEFTYNLDQIFLPLKKNMKEPLFADYYLIDKKNPFDKEQTVFLKKYIYPAIDRNGWILGKQVVFNDKPFGVVVFLVDKEPVYAMIQKSHHDIIFYGKLSVLCALTLSLLLSLFIAIRYRMIYSRAVRDFKLSASVPLSPENIDISLPENDGMPYSPAPPEASVPETPHCAPSPYVEYEVDARLSPELKTLVQDAIPVRKSIH
ncbi:MAG: hypothetical protein ACRCUT_06225 [Spirochaetota bacterium]